MKYLVIYAGCAECRFSLTESILSAEGPFDTVEEAKKVVLGDNSRPLRWVEHPQGGWFEADGQGDSWILPVPDNTVVKENV